jgi:tRNA threonylcarbamoyladenosine dehydratase
VNVSADLNNQGHCVLEDVDLERRFSGVQRLFGASAFQSLQRAHVVVIGVGGVGSWAAEALTRSGVGCITMIDLDHIAESNVNRQIHALSSTVGMAKVLAMQQRIAQIHPACRVHAIDEFVEPENWPQILPEPPDAVIDACDQVKTKTALAHWARHNPKIPLVTVGAAGGKRQAHRVQIADMCQVTHDPLLSKIRYNLRKSYAAPKAPKLLGVTCVYSDEAVSMPDAQCAASPQANLSCHGYGSFVPVTATFGMVAAGWVLEKISRKTHAIS